MRAWTVALVAGAGALMLVTLPDCVWDPSGVGFEPPPPFVGCWGALSPEPVLLQLAQRTEDPLRLGLLRLGPPGEMALQYVLHGRVESDQLAIFEGFLAGSEGELHQIDVLRSVDDTLTVSIGEGPPHGPLPKCLPGDLAPDDLVEF